MTQRAKNGPLFFSMAMSISEGALEKIKGLAAEVSQREGCFLYDLELVGSAQNRVLRVFIDGEAGGVAIDQCANVSRGLSLLLDVEDLIPGGAYELEVSSPGVERPLTQLWHYERAVGETIKVRTKEVVYPVGQKPDRKSKVKQLIGKLLAASNEGIKIEAEGKEWLLPLAIVHRANVIFKFGNNVGKRPKNKKR